MYSKEIEGILSSKKISPGDHIILSRNGTEIEGILMQRPDTGDPNILVLKLKNGYNIGLRFEEESMLEKIKAHEEKHGAETMNITHKGLNKIGLIYTGGTIGSKVDYATGGVKALTKPEELMHKVPELEGIAEIRINNLMSFMSEDISYIEWQEIAKAVASEFKAGARGVMITHGTDTLHYTAAALSFMLKGLNGPVALIGGQRSPDRGSSDAFMNMVCGAYLAAQSDAAEIGTCMHATSSDTICHFIRGTHVRKVHTSRRDAFKPINNRPIASVDPKGNIKYISEYTKIDGDPKKVSAVTAFEPKIALHKIYPGSDPSILDYYASKGYKGVILEGTGLGHGPVSTPHKHFNWLEGVRDAVKSGLIIGMTSQCIYGRVSETVYSNLRLMRKAGAIYCEDMLPEVAFVKLGWLLGNYKKTDAEKMLNENMVGEITPRSEVDWFGD